MKIFAVVLAAALALAGCEQVDAVKAMFTPSPKCHDQEVLNTVVSFFGEKVLSNLGDRANKLRGAIDAIHPRNYDFENILDVTKKDAVARSCQARMKLTPPAGYGIDATLLPNLALRNGLENEVLGIQGLSRRRPPALDYPPDITPGKSIEWDLRYRIQKTSDGNDVTVALESPSSESIASFLTYYITANQ